MSSSTSLQPRSNSGGGSGLPARCRPVSKADGLAATENGGVGIQLTRHQPGPVSCCLHALQDGQQRPPTAAVIADPDEAQDAVRLICSGHACGQVLWAHVDCLNRWERASHQKASSTTSMKFSESAQKAALRCPCGKGQLVKDQQQQQQQQQQQHRLTAPTAASQPQVIGRRRQQQPTASGGVNGFYLAGSGGGGGGSGSYSSPTDMLNRRLRNLSNSSSHGVAFSLSPTMSDVPFSSIVYSSAAATSLQPPNQPPHQLQSQLRNRGNIFRRRTDNYESLKALPRSKQNKFHIVTEDDSSTENDELKALVLTTLTACRTSHVACALCNHQMPVYDHFPLIDGLFFLSPVRHHRSDSPSCGKGFLYAVCLQCACRTRPTQLHSRCRYCQRPWDGSHLLIGGIYTFDVLACSPCCPERLLCSQCRRPLVTEPSDMPAAFSQFSQPLACPHCRVADFHFVRSVSLACRVQGVGGSGAELSSSVAAATGTTSV